LASAVFAYYSTHEAYSQSTYTFFWKKTLFSFAKQIILQKKQGGGYSRACSTVGYPEPRYSSIKVYFRPIVPMAAIW